MGTGEVESGHHEIRNHMFSAYLLHLNSAGLSLVALSNHTSLSEGGTALLTCVGYGTPDVEVSWSFNNETVTNSPTVTVISDERVLPEQGVMRQSTLQICDADEISSTGEYMCIISVGPLSQNASTQLFLSGKCIS